MSRPLISVVVPSYNHEKYIVECLDSIVAQTYRPIEIIIVDDGSQDQSPKIIKNYILKNKSNSGLIFKAYFQSNKGAHQAINYGVNKSKGELISLMNSDDLYHRDRLQMLSQPILEGRTQFAISLLDFIDTNSKKLDSSNGKFLWFYEQISLRNQFPSLSWALFVRAFHMTSSNFMFSRQLFKQLKGFRDYRWCHDFDFLLRSFILTEPVMVSRQLASYRLHGENTISSIEVNQQRYLHELRRIYEDYHEQIIIDYKNKKPINPICPSPYNWPQVYSQRFFYERFYFLSEMNYVQFISLLNSHVTQVKDGDVGSLLSRMRLDIYGATEILLSLRAYHYLHADNFNCKIDKSFKSAKIKKINPIFFNKQVIGNQITVQAQIKLPYDDKMGLLAIFASSRMIAVLRFIRRSGDNLIFSGFATEDLTDVKRNSIHIYWMDFSDKVFVLKKSTSNKYYKSTKKPLLNPMLPVGGHLDFVGMDRQSITVRGWGLIHGQLPEQYELYIDHKKMSLLPRLYARSDLKKLLINEDSHGCAGFYYHVDTHQFTKRKSRYHIKVIIHGYGKKLVMRGQISLKKWQLD